MQVLSETWKKGRFPGGQRLLLSDLGCTVKYFRPSGGAPKPQSHIELRVRSYIPEWGIYKCPKREKFVNSTLNQLRKL